MQAAIAYMNACPHQHQVRPCRHTHSYRAKARASSSFETHPQQWGIVACFNPAPRPEIVSQSAHTHSHRATACNVQPTSNPAPAATHYVQHTKHRCTPVLHSTKCGTPHHKTCHDVQLPAYLARTLCQTLVKPGTPDEQHGQTPTQS